NYNPYPVQLKITFSLASDFADIFEVRGFRRQNRGHHDPPVVGERHVEFVYHGLDGVTRRTVAEFGPQPDRIRVVRIWWRSTSTCGWLPTRPGCSRPRWTP